jgi:putative transferase (TIGR04331 family)
LRLGGDHGWDQSERWSNAMPELKINLGVGSIHKLINKSRIFISTYNATTYLESLSWNIPTIIFWNPDHWELNKEAKPYFELLKLAGIFHETPESAARQMIEVWGDVDEWWKSEKVQNAKNVFCYQYARISSNSLDELEATFGSVINND